MTRTPIAWLGLAVALIVCSTPAVAEETPYGKGMTEANKERLVLDDMEDVADWYNGSPEETTISASDRHVKSGDHALLFANVVDHTRGEAKYPVGWPRTGKDLVREKLTDWSDYDFFECWIYVDTSRATLPKTPLGVGFYHTGQKRSSQFPLGEVKKDAWVKIAIAVADLLDPTDVRRVQFNISERDYKHGDRVDFYIDDPVLTRFVEPAIAELRPQRKILFSHDRVLRAEYELVGYKGLEKTRVELSIGRSGEPPAAKTSGAAAEPGELVLPLDARISPGTYQVTLGLRDENQKLIDRKQAQLRVIAGPFDEE